MAKGLLEQFVRSDGEVAELYVATAVPARDATQPVFWFAASVHVWLLTLATYGLALAVAPGDPPAPRARRHERP